MKPADKSTVIATNWTDFLALIKRLKPRDPERETWFRGQSNAQFSLLPSLFRSTKGVEKEAELYRKYRQINHRIQPQGKGEWETLFDMQHYWIPTRLLDWSESLGVAVYFAVRYNRLRTDMAIYLLDPQELNSYSKKNSIPIIPDDSLGLVYVRNYLNKDPFPPQFPIAIRPNFSNDRMLAQRGIFTIHGDDVTPIERLCPKAVTKVILSKDAIEDATEFLEIANINEYTIFPDISGVADYLRRMLE